jgi:hypothetical protein
VSDRPDNPAQAPAAATPPGAKPPAPPAAEPLADPHARADALTAQARRDIAEEKAKAAQIGEDLDKLEKEAFPDRPKPDSPGQIVGT